MKRTVRQLAFSISLTVLMLISSSESKAQWGVIDSLKLIPSSPTSNSTVQVVCYSTFGYMACFMTDSSVSINGNIITVNAHHMQGMLTAICNSIDTLIIGSNFSGGNYTVIYNLMDTASILYDDDTLYFFIEEILSEQTPEHHNEINIFPNPAEENLNIISNHSSILKIEMLDITGQFIYAEEKKSDTQNTSASIISIQSFPPGLYFIKLKMEDGSEVMKRFVKE